MGHYRKIDTRIWNDEKFRRVGEPGRFLFFFILTHPHMTPLGAMRASRGGLADEIGWEIDKCKDALDSLSKMGMIEFDSDARCIYVPKFLKHNQPENPNVVKSWIKTFDLIPECKLRTKAFHAAKALMQSLTTEYLKAFEKAFQEVFPEGFQETWRQGSRIQEQEQEQYTKNNSSSSKKSKNCYGDAVTEKSPKKKSEPPPPDRKPRHDPKEEFRREELSRFVDILRTYVPVAKNTPKPELYKFAAWFSARFRSESEPVRVAEHVVRYRMKYFLELKTWKDVYAYATRVDQDPETINEARSRAYKSIPPVDVGLDKKPP